jgi:glutaredoxin-like protein NrdH
MSKVTVYTLPSCVQCDTTKRYLQRNLIEFNEIKLQDDPEAMEAIKAMGYSQAPVVVAGDARWSGFRPDELQLLLKAA